MEEKTILEIQQSMQDRRLSAKELCQDYLKNIQDKNHAGPMVNAIIDLNPEFLEIADALDKERAFKGPRSHLHGIPILLKDNIDTADMLPTGAGSLALANSYAPKDAFLVARLREAGAIIMGKANMNEWANIRSPHSICGWSSRGGLTRNPYVLNRTPFGSSCGSAVAVAANFCSLAVGTETDGSIIKPSSAASIVGLKPTAGLVSRSGVIPLALSYDSPGPMSQNVSDCALLLNSLSHYDPRDSKSKLGSRPDYTRFLKKEGLQKARIGVARNFFGFDPKVDQLMEGVIDILKKMGAIVIDCTIDSVIPWITEGEFEVFCTEFKVGLENYLKTRQGIPIHNLEDLIQYNKQHADKTMVFFGQENLDLANTTQGLTSISYLKAKENCLNLATHLGIDKTLKTENLDAIMAPSEGVPFLIDPLCGDYGFHNSHTHAAVAGYPNISVPAGFINELPIGVSFFSRAYEEARLIQFAYAFEQESQFRRTPKFLKEISLF